jgi:hypothetical protein
MVVLYALWKRPLLLPRSLNTHGVRYVHAREQEGTVFVQVHYIRYRIGEKHQIGGSRCKEEEEEKRQVRINRPTGTIVVVGASRASMYSVVVVVVVVIVVYEYVCRFVYNSKSGK